MKPDTFRTFKTAYLKVLPEQSETPFLSVTPDFEQGPGIERDGLTTPRMLDPHTVAQAMQGISLPEFPLGKFPATTNAWVQRAGTRTLFNHIHAFFEQYGDRYSIVAVQSCGDLTMNLWHVALIQKKDPQGHVRSVLCHLNTPTSKMKEDLNQNSPYRCLVKWKPNGARRTFEFLDLYFHNTTPNAEACLAEHGANADLVSQLKSNFNLDDRLNVAPHLEFALAGKLIIENGKDISLANAIDRFQDVRHVFNLPTVTANGFSNGVPVSSINFGEFLLYNQKNVRRAALHSPIIVPLGSDNVTVDLRDLEGVLKTKHYRRSDTSPTRRGEYRVYSSGEVEIFFPYNVYPFGVVGISRDGLVTLASGGLSGRVGNTLDGITRVTFDFFGCEDAMVLDEGFDTFLLSNLVDSNSDKQRVLCFDNEDFLSQAAQFSIWRAEQDHRESIARNPKEPTMPSDTEIYHERVHAYLKSTNRSVAPIKDFREWPLNRKHFQSLTDYANRKNLIALDPSKIPICAVPPLRSQMRAVLIYAREKPKS